MEEIDDLEAEEDPVQEPEEVPQDDRNDNVRHQMEQELQQARQAVGNFAQTIAELREQKTCQSRRFERGTIHCEMDRMMRCAFCEVTGNHYPDFCVAVRSTQEGRRVIERQRKCSMCPEIVLEAGIAPNTLQGAIIVVSFITIRRYVICRIFQQLAAAQDGKVQCEDRIDELEWNLAHWKRINATNALLGREYRGWTAML
ncbi:unnamed protein product [Heligmosomoides polygyrus]|uniref:RING-type domain-containing protein n=1 Tax=Heligmosomoides polygyrus TaxID=6339 RepID=A0A183GSG7_HELPZ|nr:unnamed protein product [Heligmosomoides polygyrus]